LPQQRLWSLGGVPLIQLSGPMCHWLLRRVNSKFRAKTAHLLLCPISLLRLPRDWVSYYDFYLTYITRCIDVECDSLYTHKTMFNQL